ncbi:MAG: GMC family oxidoreductase [Rhodothermaceae bacterium]|nr:GMC family oxidoreductase [Rhodothermaceae bacterium]
MTDNFDIVIIGTGAGGGTLAYGLRNSGAKILLIERGDYLPQEPENWDPEEAYFNSRYKATEKWYDSKGKAFRPGVHYFVGGNTKVYGAALPRFRKEDFEDLEHEGGTSPGWPVSYEELEPYYTAAERIYNVHGEAGHDPTEPPRSAPYPFPPVPHEAYVEDLSDRLKQQGLNPFYYPMGIDLREGGDCIRCKTCDGFPCKVHAKSDTDVCCVRPAITNPNVTLWTNTTALRLFTDETGKSIKALEVERNGLHINIHAGIYIVACGAVNSAALLLRSANDKHPLGLANSSDQVGRNYMVHNNSGLVAIDPRRKNDVVFQKTMAVNDFYLRGPDWNYPLGNLQLLGKVQAPMVAAAKPNVPRFMLKMMTDRSIDWWVMSEDLPDPENRVHLTNKGKIQIQWTPNNMASHHKLAEEATNMLKEAGYPLVFVEPMGIATNSHQCGTIRCGHDPATSVLDPYCKSHDVANLFVVDSSFFPSSAAMNPALTIAAQALRVADHLMSPS